MLALISLGCFAMLAFGLYLQHSVGLSPCPMCIVQRYALFCVGLVAAVALLRTGAWMRWFSVIAMGLAGFGAFVAARQSFLQWYPPEVMSCGRDFYGMIEHYSPMRWMGMIFKGSGDCAAVDWTFLGGSIANWSFVSFVGIFCALGFAWAMSHRDV